MMDWTDRHCRAFHRLLAPRALLYTEMVTTGALIHGDAARHLDFSACERPVALQLGGNEPEALARCAAMGADWGYQEINLNCGCPSDRVQNGFFGACLMAAPDQVAAGVRAMKRAVEDALAVTVKTRIGIDHQDDYAFLHRFCAAQVAAGADALILHARKAWLQGLSPKQNREIPPLDYDRVYRLKADFPTTPIILNGGLTEPSQLCAPLARLDGVMIGRAAWHTPAVLAAMHRTVHGGEGPTDGASVVRSHRAYVADQLDQGVPLHRLVKPLLGLFQGMPGARLWRRTLSVEGAKPGADLAVLDEALDRVEQEGARAAARLAEVTATTAAATPS